MDQCLVRYIVVIVKYGTQMMYIFSYNNLFADWVSHFNFANGTFTQCIGIIFSSSKNFVLNLSFCVVVCSILILQTFCSFGSKITILHQTHLNEHFNCWFLCETGRKVAKGSTTIGTLINRMHTQNKTKKLVTQNCIIWWLPYNNNA